MKTYNDSPQIIIDAHVHGHACFDIDALLDAAFHAFSEVAQATSCLHRFTGVLLLADLPNAPLFEQLRQPGTSLLRHWHQEKIVEDDQALWMHHPDGGRLLLIAGNQLVSAEKLEVLALGGQAPHAQGLPLHQLIATLQANGALPVLPWGVGKWLGARGRLVTELLQQLPTGAPLLLGDNGNRPRCWPEPAQFRQAAAKGIRVLPGSDPLPLPGELERVGRFGAILSGTLDEQPTRQLQQLLLDPRITLRRYGCLQNLRPFLRNQLLLRLHQHRCHAASALSKSHG